MQDVFKSVIFACFFHGNAINIKLPCRSETLRDVAGRPLSPENSYAFLDDPLLWKLMSLLCKTLAIVVILNWF